MWEVFWMFLLLLFFVVSLATAPGYDHQTAAQVKVSVWNKVKRNVKWYKFLWARAQTKMDEL